MFSWPRYPENEAEFEVLMRAIDDALTVQGLAPFQRPLHISRKLWEAFKWSGDTLPDKRLAEQPSFRGQVLLAKAYRWYDEFYGDRLKGGMTYGYAPARLGNTIWRVYAGLTFGYVVYFVDRDLSNKGKTLARTKSEPPASWNALCAVEQLPQGLAARLTDSELREYLRFFCFMHASLKWRDSLPKEELFKVAYSDYEESTAAVVERRFSQSKWASQQAVEKTIKGLLTLNGTEFPTGARKGHDLRHLSTLLEISLGVRLPTPLLAFAECSPRVRYGEETPRESDALAANHAVLGVLGLLRQSASVNTMVSEIKAKKSAT